MCKLDILLMVDLKQHVSTLANLQADGINKDAKQESLDKSPQPQSKS